MAIEKRTYFLGIVPGKQETAPPNDIELRSPKLSLEDKIISAIVDSPDELLVIKNKKGSSKTLIKDEINKEKIRIRHTLFSSYGYKWKKD